MMNSSTGELGWPRPGVNESDDLFDAAESLGARLGAPVTVEDAQSRVIAYSTHPDVVDVARTESVMSRRVPDQYLSRMRVHGVLRRLFESEEPIFIPGRPPDIRPRVAIAIRAGREVLGSVWVAVDEPLSAELSQTLVDAASALAVRLLRRRVALDYERRIHTETVVRLLSDSPDTTPQAAMLEFLPLSRVVIAAWPCQHPNQREDLDWELDALAAALRTQLLATAPESITGRVDHAVYGIMPAGRFTGSNTALHHGLNQFVRSYTRDARHGSLRIGIGSVVGTAEELPESREMADLVVDVLVDRSQENAVASIGEVSAPGLVLKARQIVGRIPALGELSVQRVKAYDIKNQTMLAQTLYAWLRCHGSCELAATELQVHANTVRYRIRQLRELDLIDLDDPDERIAAYLHLRG